jgi:hypothetical protein
MSATDRNRPVKEIRRSAVIGGGPKVIMTAT